MIKQLFSILIDIGIDRMGIGYKSTPIVLGYSGKTSTDVY